MYYKTGIRDTFIGREKELVHFKTWLVASHDDVPWILYVHDALEAAEKKGGVGKTWLLREFAMVAEQLHPSMIVVAIDFFNIAEREGFVIAERIVDTLRLTNPQWSPNAFDEVLLEYRHALGGGKEEIGEIRNKLADALIADLRLLDEQLQENHRSILLLFDTYEQIEENPMIAALRLAQTFPDNYQFEQMRVVIAGRNALNWNHPNWRGRQREIQTMAISPFTQDEMLRYLDKVSGVEGNHPEQLQKLYERTEGRPILVGLAADVLKRNIMTLDTLAGTPKEEFESTLVMKINNLESPIDTIILFMAHIYHRFNLSLLEWIVREAHMSDLLQGTALETLPMQLLRLSFVRRSSSGNDFALHDEMVPLVVKHCWDKQYSDPQRQTRKELSRYVIDYYNHELASVQMEQLRQAYNVEMLYHKFYVHPDAGYAEFEKLFQKAIDLWLSAFARSLLQVARQFIQHMSPLQRYSMKYFEAQLLEKEENAQQALTLFAELEQEADPHWLAARRSDIFYEKAVCYQQLSDFPNAIECFNISKDIEKAQGNMSDYASLLNWLGYSYHRQGQFDMALRYFEEAIDVNEQLGHRRSYAGVLNSIANLYRQQGKTEEALRRCKIAWRIRYDLFKNGEVSEVYVAWSLSAIGTVYLHIDDLVKAEHYFREAFDIFIRIGHRKGLATMYNRFGKIAMERKDLADALQWFRKAYYTAPSVDAESQISSLNKQGWVLAQEGKFLEAVHLLQQAIELAVKTHDDYQQAESLIDLAEVCAHMERQEVSRETYSHAEAISQKYNYNYLLGLSRESQGDIKYQNGDYKAAFRYYGDACRYMAYYNTIKYNKTLRKVVDTLLETPYEEIGPIADALVAYWFHHEMDRSYPDFINSCEEVKLLMRA